jgi:hypothetical protein
MRAMMPRMATLGPWALLSALGCGTAVSLDEPGSSSGEPLTSAGPFGTGVSPTDDGTTYGLPDDEGSPEVGDVKLDVAPDIPLPPGSCPPDCQFELTAAWIYEGPTSVPPVALDPQDQVAVIVDFDGAVTVAEERAGELLLARLDTRGQELWNMPLRLPCSPCRLVELGLHPSGDLLLAGHGIDALGSPVALAVRVELGGPELVWATSTPLIGGHGIVPRAGSLVAHDEDLLLQPVLEGSLADGLERLELFAYDGASGGLMVADPLTTSLGSGDAPPPRAAYDTLGALVVTHPMWAEAASISGTVRWSTALGAEVLATAPRVEPSLQLVTSPDGRALTLGQTTGTEQSVLHLDSGALEEPEQWSVPYELATVPSGSPTLAVDGYGHAHVVARIAQGPPDREHDVGLQVLRWSDEGNLVWKLVVPLAMDRVDQPVALALTPDGEGELVLGGFVGGARHVEKRVPGCDCG